MPGGQDIVLVLRVDDKGTRVIQQFSTKGTQAFKDLDKSVKKSGRNLDAIAGKLKNVGRSLTMKMTLPIVGIGVAALKMSMDFNKSMSNVATLIPGNIKRIRDLKLEVQDMSVVFGKSTKDVSEGLYQVISALGDTADTTKILEINVRAASAGMATTLDAINLTTAVTKGYNDTTAEATQKAADLAFMAVKLGQTTFPELAQSIGRVVPIMAKLGAKQKELFAIFATLTGVTGKANEVGTQLAGILRALMKPTDEMTRLIGEMEYASAEQLITELGVVEAMRQLQARTDGTAAGMAKLFSRAEALVAVFALTGTQADVYNEKLAKMDDYMGALDEAFKEVAEGINKTGFQFQQLKQMTVVLAQSLGDALAPALGKIVVSLKPVLEGMIGLVNAIAAAPGFVKALIGGLGLLLAMLGPLFMIMGRVLWTIGQFKRAQVATKFVTFLGKALRALSVAGKAMVGTLGILVAALGATIYYTQKVRAAQEELVKSEERVNEQAQTQANRWAMVAKEAGLTTQEMMKMTRAYKGNYSEMFRAIKQGEVTEKLQKAYIKTIKILKGEMKAIPIEVKKAMDVFVDKFKAGDYEVDEMIKDIQYFIDQFKTAKQEIPESLGAILKSLQDERAAMNAAAKALKAKEAAWKELVASYQSAIPTVEGVQLQFDALQEALKNVEEKGGDVDAVVKALEEKITALYEAGTIAAKIFGVDLPEGLEELKNKLTEVDEAWDGLMAGDTPSERLSALQDAARDASKDFQFITDIVDSIGTAFTPLGMTTEEWVAALDKAAKSEAWRVQLEGIREFQKVLAEIIKYVDLVTSAWDAMWGQVHENQMARIDNEYQARKEAIDASLMSDQAKYFAVEKLDRELEKKRRAAERRMAIASKASSLVGAITNTAEAVTKALTAGPFIGPILAAIIGAMGAVQIALIAAQSIPAMAKGGIIGLHGPEVFLGGERGPEVVRPLAEDRRMMAAVPARKVEATFSANFYISSPDTMGWQRITREKIAPEFIEWVRLNKSELLEAMEE